MIRYILCLLLLLSFRLNAQTEDEILAKQAVVQFFEGFHKKDSTLMQEVVHKDIILQTTFTNKKGEAILKNQDAKGFIKAVVSRAEYPSRTMSF